MAAKPASKAPAQAPVPLGRFQLFKLLKKGGMARVFLANVTAPKDSDGPDAPTLVAVKTLLPELVSRKTYREMFASEAEVGRRLQHPNIARTLEHGEDRNTAWIAMEYVFGFDLSMVMRRLRKRGERMGITMAVGLAREVADALSYAHALTDEFGQPLNIVNRDVSPGNVMLAFDGTVKLIDFGIAQTTIDLKSQIGSIKGKISYMAPEQVRGLPVDKRVDIFSLGTVLYEMLTGVQVFRDSGDFATMERVRRADAPPPSTHTVGIDQELDAIIARALAREADDRYPDAGELATDLAEWLAAHAVVVDAQESRARFMRTLFGQQIDEIRAEIETARLETTDAQATTAAPRFISEAALADMLAAEKQGGPTPPPRPLDPPAEGLTPRLMIAALLVAGLAVVAWLLLRP